MSSYQTSGTGGEADQSEGGMQRGEGGRGVLDISGRMRGRKEQVKEAKRQKRGRKKTRRES